MAFINSIDIDEIIKGWTSVLLTMLQPFRLM